IPDRQREEIEELRIEIWAEHEEVLRQQSGLGTTVGEPLAKRLRYRTEDLALVQIPQRLVQGEIEDEERVMLPGIRAVLPDAANAGLVDFDHLGAQRRPSQSLIDHQVGEQVDERVFREGYQRALQQAQARVDLEGARVAHVVPNLMGKHGRNALLQAHLGDEPLVEGDAARVEINLRDAGLMSV